MMQKESVLRHGQAMGKNLGGAVCLFLVPKIIEVIVAWAAQ